MIIGDKRELAYIVKIDDISPLPGYDRVESAHVGGWRIVVRKGQFKPGDYAIYFEIDSKVPETEPFMFLAPKKFKVKTQKMCKSISQGLLMSVDDFLIGKDQPSWAVNLKSRIIQGENVEHEVLTDAIGVTYADAEDNKRKAASVDKYKKMAQRKPTLFKKPWARWMMKREWGRKIMFFFFGKKKDKKNGWPEWVSKTDEERIENLPHYFEDKKELIATEKIDGTSTTFTIHKRPFNKWDFYTCSRNVVFDKPDKKCFYETNVYIEMSEKYHMEEVLKQICLDYNLEWATIQGETYGTGIQKRSYYDNFHDFRAFNLIFSNRGRLGSIEGKNILAKYGIPWVPILDEHFVMPDTIDELREYVNSEKSKIDGGMREGVVFRGQDGVKSFKCVSPEFLIKYHNN